MRRKRSAGHETYNSLLDTTTNVVGILIIVLVVAQLGFRDAVARVGASSNAGQGVSPEIVAERRQSINELAQEAFELQGEYEKSVAANRDKSERAEFLRRQIEIREAELVRMDSAADASNNPELQRQIAEVEQLRVEVEKARSAVAQLDEQQKQAAQNPRKNAKRARFPEPRPAPEDLEPSVFLCRYGRIRPLDDATAEAPLEAIKKALGLNPSLKEVNLDQDQLPRIQSYFDSNYVGGRGLRWRMELDTSLVVFTIPFLKLEWTSQTEGETLAELGSSSSYSRALAGINPRTHLVTYVVWSDSFEVYLNAREQAQERGFNAFWIAMDTKEELRNALIGGGGGMMMD